MLQPRHQSTNSNSYPNPCHIKPINNNYNTAFPPDSLPNARAPSVHQAPLAVCFLVRTLLPGDSSGDVAPSFSLDISQGLGWAPFSLSHGSLVLFHVPSVLTHKSAFPSLPPTHKSLCTSSSASSRATWTKPSTLFLTSSTLPLPAFLHYFLNFSSLPAPSLSPRTALSALPFILLPFPSHIQAIKI